MALSIADIQNKVFSAAPEGEPGYEPTEVDVFIEEFCGDYASALAKIVDLKDRLTAAEQQLAEAPAAVAPAPAPAPAPAVDFSASERQISAALIAAQQAADRIIAEAQENADRIVSDAEAKAREVKRQVLAEKQAELEEIDRLKASREEFKGEYLRLIQHFMDDAQNEFPTDLVMNTPTGSVPAAAPAAEPVVEPEPAPAPAPVAPAADVFAPAPSMDFIADDLD